jgi:hypothetical protein
MMRILLTVIAGIGLGAVAMAAFHGDCANDR